MIITTTVANSVFFFFLIFKQFSKMCGAKLLSNIHTFYFKFAKH